MYLYRNFYDGVSRLYYSMFILVYVVFFEEVDFILWLIDVIFIVIIVIVIVFIWFFVCKLVDSLLVLFNKLNCDISKFSIVDKNVIIVVKELVKEL